MLLRKFITVNRRVIALSVFLIFAVYAQCDNRIDSLFIDAVIHGDGESAVMLLRQGANINAIDGTGASLLHKAALYSNQNLALWLLEHGADINMQVGNNRLTPLMLAAHQQDVPMCKFFVENHATLGIKDKNGLTASDYAFNTGYIALAKYLKNPKVKLQEPLLAELISKAATAFSSYDYTGAIKINEELCVRLKKEIAPTCILYTKGLNDLGMCYMTIGDYDKAKKYLKEAVSVAKKHTPNSNIYYTRCIYYSSILFNNSEFDEAFSIYLDCLQNIEVITDPQMRWTVYNNMGVIASHWGQYELAEKMLSNAVSLGESLYQANDGQYPMYAFSLANLGGMYMEQGNSNVQVKAETFLSKALDIYRAHEDYGREYAGAYKNYGALMANMGNYDLALQIYTSYSNTIERVFGKEHDEYAYSLDAIAGIYIHQSKYDEALNLLLEAKRIREQNHSMQSPQGALLLINLGDLCERIEIARPDTKTSAEDYFKEAINILENTIGTDNLKYAGAINYLSAYYYRYERYQQALELEEKSMGIIERIIGKQNQNYLTFYANKCATLQSQHRWSKALSAWQDFTGLFKDYVKDMFPILSEEERNLFWNSSFEWRYESMIPSMAHLSNDSSIDVNGFAYDNALFTKGILLSSSEQIRRAILNSGDAGLIEALRELNSTKSMLLQQQESPLHHTAEIIDSLKIRIRYLDKYLSQHSVEYKTERATWDYSWQMVQNAMPHNSIAIEFLKFNLWDHYEKDSAIYAALIIDKTCASPIYVPLFTEREIRSLFDTSTEGLTNITYSVDGNGADLTNLIWGHLFTYLENKENIFFAPSGVIHQLAIEALPLNESLSMADEYNLVRLSSTRELVSLDKSDTIYSATLYGGIKYDVENDELLAQSRSYSITSSSAYRSLVNDSTNRGSVNYLSGTMEEVENIGELLKGNNIQVTLHSATAANEESFKSLDGKHQDILHIATHGFFWPDSIAKSKEYYMHRSISGTQNASALVYIDPLNRCGLLLAGANKALQGLRNELPEGVQDGILTAKEISLLDFRDAALVVLSACETGKGEITGDGVFGLQRAFKQAGVRTIIMSLWPVNDAATQLLMTEFYRNWITNHQSKREAFRNAQNTVRSKYEEPVYWAGFIMLD